MAGNLYAVGDIGATRLRIGIYDEFQNCVDTRLALTEPDNYESTVQRAADMVDVLTQGHAIKAASMAVAAEVADDGTLTKSGALTPWVGKNIRTDMEQALGLDAGLVGAHNDVVAIALSQQHVNRQNGKPVQGIATTLSSGWGGALYWEAGKTKSDEPGHEFLRDGATCPCGGVGHAEAHISGKGIELNKGISMKDWLANVPSARAELTEDITAAAIAMVQRVEAGVPDGEFAAQEVRWTGGVALGQTAIVMGQVASRVQAHFREQKGRSIAFDLATLGEAAGLHGTFIDAQQRAIAY